MEKHLQTGAQNWIFAAGCPMPDSIPVKTCATGTGHRIGEMDKKDATCTDLA